MSPKELAVAKKIQSRLLEIQSGLQELKSQIPSSVADLLAMVHVEMVELQPGMKIDLDDMDAVLRFACEEHGKAAVRLINKRQS